MRPTPLFAVVSTALATVLGLQAWMATSAYHRDLDFFAVRAANRAQATANQVQAVFKEVDLMLLGLRAQIDPAELLAPPLPGDHPRVEELRRRFRAALAEVPQALGVQVVRADGSYAFTSFNALPTVSLADRPYFQRQREAVVDEAVVSDLLFARVSQRWAVFPCRRIQTADGRFAGLILATVDTDELGRCLTAVDQQQWVLGLVEAGGRVVARAPANAALINTVPPGMERLAGGHWRGSGLGFEHPHLWAAQPLGRLPFTAVAGVSEDFALQQWRQDLRIHLAVGLALMAGGAVILLLHQRNRRARADLEALHARMRQAARAVGLGFWTWDPRSGVHTWDEGMTALTGQIPEALESGGDPLLACLVPEDQPLLERLRGEARTSRQPVEGTCRFQRRDGPVRHLRSTLVASADGRVCGFSWDVTGAEQARLALVSSESYFRALFNAAPDAIAVIHEGRVVDANRRYHELFPGQALDATPP